MENVTYEIEAIKTTVNLSHTVFGRQTTEGSSRTTGWALVRNSRRIATFRTRKEAQAALDRRTGK